MQGQTRVMCAVLSIFCLLAGAGSGRAADDGIKAAKPAASIVPTEVSSQARTRQRAPHRVHIYGRSRGPGPNSVRICNAYYEQEFRPSGTVIVPKMRCYWSG